MNINIYDTLVFMIVLYDSTVTPLTCFLIPQYIYIPTSMSLGWDNKTIKHILSMQGTIIIIRIAAFHLRHNDSKLRQTKTNKQAISRYYIFNSRSLVLDKMEAYEVDRALYSIYATCTLLRDSMSR
jgi:hypothetical protein